MMLDAAGNKYPASQKYDASSAMKPNGTNVVIYTTTGEAQHFGAGWNNIEGIEVNVTFILFPDAKPWKPKPDVVCKTTFVNSDYDKETEKRGKDEKQKMKKALEKMRIREHSIKQAPITPTEPKTP
jgi:hypothetical protein